jgi:hypothetical protein
MGHPTAPHFLTESSTSTVEVFVDRCLPFCRPLAPPLHLLLLRDGLHGSISSGIACHPWLRRHHRHLAAPPHRQPVVGLSSSPSPLPSISSIVAVDESPKSLILTSTPADSVIVDANPPPGAVTVPPHHTSLPACSCGSATTFVSVSTTATLPTPSPPSPPRI